MLPPMPAIAYRVHPGEESLTIVSRSVQWRIDTPVIFNQKTSCERTFTLANCTWCLELKNKRTHVSNSRTEMYLGSNGFIISPNYLGESYILNLSVLNSGDQYVHAQFVLRIGLTDMIGQSALKDKFDGKECFKTGGYSLERTISDIKGKRLVIDFEFLEVMISHSKDNEVASESLGEEERLRAVAAQVSINCLSRMFTESLHADVTINTKDGTLSAHKAVLAASSPVFACMFDNDFEEKKSSTIDIQDMSFESCKMFLGFLYGVLKEEDIWAHRWSLFEASHKYRVTNLQNVCEERLIEDINLSNVLERLGQAHFYELEKLKKGCLDYLFVLGRVYEILDDFTCFTLDADRGLATEIIWKMLAK